MSDTTPAPVPGTTAQAWRGIAAEEVEDLPAGLATLLRLRGRRLLQDLLRPHRARVQLILLLIVIANLAALAGVTIQFEAIEGGDMEGVAAVGNLRNASAVFFYHRGQWHTTGKAVFNLNPDEALTHFAAQYERLPAA